MRIDIATLFPEMCDRVLNESILGRARRQGLFEVHCHNIRDYTLSKQKRVDDCLLYTSPSFGTLPNVRAPQEKIRGQKQA